tara:strand:- start:539 stop:784 length:246 start_codon:yes stop_codon:yes gene_type:complete
MSVGVEHVFFSASDLKTSEATLQACGGISGLEDSLETSFTKGIKGDVQDVEARVKKYGTNRIEEKEVDSWMAMFIGECRVT